MATEVTYRCWCKNDDCDWEHEVTKENSVLAQEAASAKITGHAIAEEHFETRMQIA